MGRWRVALENTLNPLATALLIGWAAVIGSFASALLYGAVIWSVALLASRRIRLPSRPEPYWIAAAFGAFFLAYAMSAALNGWSLAAGASVGEVIPFLAFLPLYARLAALPRRAFIGWLEAGVVTGAFASLAAALIDLFVSGIARAEGLAGNAGVFGMITACLFGLSLLVASRHQGVRRWVAAAACLGAAVALLLSGLRSLWPILIVAPLILASLSAGRLGRGMIVGLGALVVTALFVEGITGVVRSRLELALADFRAIAERGDYDNSFGHRLRIWEAGLTLVAEKPLFGHGSAGMEMLIEERTARDEQRPLVFTHLHNFVLDALARNGLFGFVALILVLGLPVHLARRRTPDAPAEFGYAALLLVQASYVLSGLTGHMIGHDVLDAYFIYATAAASALMFTGQPPRRALPMTAETATLNARPLRSTLIPLGHNEL